MSYEEDAAIDADMRVSSFTGPHVHLDWEVPARLIPVWDDWTKSWREDFARVERPCPGCWL